MHYLVGRVFVHAVSRAGEGVKCEIMSIRMIGQVSLTFWYADRSCLVLRCRVSFVTL